MIVLISLIFHHNTIFTPDQSFEKIPSQYNGIDAVPDSLITLKVVLVMPMLYTHTLSEGHQHFIVVVFFFQEECNILVFALPLVIVMVIVIEQVHYICIMLIAQWRCLQIKKNVISTKNIKKNRVLKTERITPIMEFKIKNN